MAVKTKDVLIWGGIGIGAYFLLSKVVSITGNVAQAATAESKPNCQKACSDAADKYLRNEDFGSSLWKSDRAVYKDIYTDCMKEC